MNINEMLTVMQAAEKAGVVRQTIYEWMKSGFLPYVQIGHVRFVRKRDLERAKEEKSKRNKARNFECGEKFMWKKRKDEKE